MQVELLKLFSEGTACWIKYKSFSCVLDCVWRETLNLCQYKVYCCARRFILRPDSPLVSLIVCKYTTFNLEIAQPSDLSPLICRVANTCHSGGIAFKWWLRGSQQHFHATSMKETPKNPASVWKETWSYHLQILPSSFPTALLLLSLLWLPSSHMASLQQMIRAAMVPKHQRKAYFKELKLKPDSHRQIMCQKSSTLQR